MTTIDPDRAGAFAERLTGIFSDALVTFMIEIGHRLGLFDAAAVGPATSVELAARTGLQERYVREWLAAVTTAGIVEYEPDGRTYTLPVEHAAALTGTGSANLAPMSLLASHLATTLDDVIESFRRGGGVPYERFRPRFTDVMDRMSRGFFDERLVGGVLPLTGDLPERLRAGIRVAEIGCGTGHALNLLAAAFPASEFTGYDLAADAIEKARCEAASLGHTNAAFEVRDVASLPDGPPFDAIFAFDAIHDQADPAGVLRNIHDALAVGGTFVMLDTRSSSNLEDNVGNPAAPMLYATSVLHCMTVSLAEGGAGLGTCWGQQLAERMLADAGFEVVSVDDVPDDPVDLVYVGRRPA